MKRLSAFLLALLLLLSAAGCSAGEEEAEGLTVTCTTYPVYLMAQAVTQGTEGITLTLMIQQEISCLHNYTLTINDMKKVEGADLIAVSGAGLEDFLSDALEGRTVVDCSEGISLLWNEEEGEDDPHYWLAPANAAQMAQNLADAFGAIDPDNSARYQANAEAAAAELAAFQTALADSIPADCPRELITFHDGFAYFAEAFGFTIVAAVEEEEGAEASARRISELVDLIDQYQLPAVFVEANGSDTTAQCLAAERGSAIGVLNMGMSAGDSTETGLAAYEALLQGNLTAILEAYL
ncbi:MAG: metal ABC transporter substrate-binding protein [Clostridiales bacterium]|nr:metal ABC transporter substrate-binding protein [Clostridiales bacterium]MCD8367427.1 metal ABC transporter substrate-binding protein [Clostridiales bacterium]